MLNHCPLNPNPKGMERKGPWQSRSVVHIEEHGQEGLGGFEVEQRGGAHVARCNVGAGGTVVRQSGPETRKDRAAQAGMHRTRGRGGGVRGTGGKAFWAVDRPLKLLPSLILYMEIEFHVDLRVLC